MPPSVLLDEWRIVISIPTTLPPATVNHFRHRINTITVRRSVARAIRVALGVPMPRGVRIVIER